MVKTRPGKGQVQVRHYKRLESGCDLRQWPNAKDLKEVFDKEEIHPKQQNDEAYWQAAVRWSLLKKYNLCPEHLKDPFVRDASNEPPSISFSQADIETIRTIWEEQCDLATSNTTCNDNDLKEFLATGKSNGRPLQWSVLDCGPACQFQLHAHPNIEVIYAVQGALHEIRMEGSPVTKTFEKESNHSNKLKGPDLSSSGRSWKFATVHPGEWLVNEVGSIHKSFSATNGDGCLLLALWGGSHADVPPEQEPSSVNVQGALESMDQRLCDCGSGRWETLSETFLPQSERSKPQ